MTPAEARSRFRAGESVPTAGLVPGAVQANLIAVPADLAADLRGFTSANPAPCPVLEVLPAGSYTSALAAGSDIRTDLPAYRVWRDGEIVATVTDAREHWRTDLVTFLIGCSFTFEAALAAAGVPVKHVSLGVNVPMFRTNRQCRPVGVFHGPLVVSMRPIPAALVDRAIEVTGHYPAVHGAPVHVGDPAALGITDLSEPDYGTAVPIDDGEIPVFWACGVTPQAALETVRPEFAITHAPGHMFVTDLPDSHYRED